MKKTKDLICRSFRQDFPQFVARAEALGVTLSLSKSRRGYGRERVFWLDGYKQLTGYTTRSDGSPFTLDDASRNKALTSIEEGRWRIMRSDLADATRHRGKTGPMTDNGDDIVARLERLATEMFQSGKWGTNLETVKAAMDTSVDLRVERLLLRLMVRLHIATEERQDQ